MRKHCRQLNTSVGVSERYDFAVRAPRRSSFGVARVHRIPLRVRDDREPPLLSGRDGEGYRVIWVFGKSEYFCMEG